MRKLFILLILLLFCSRAPAGGLVIAGGRITDLSIYRQFIQQAGKSPRVAVVLTASGANFLDMDFWKSVGAASVIPVGPNDLFPTDIDAVWFIGGDQANLEAAYVGKKFEADLIDFYRKGGTIGGSSAGCAILSKVMIRGWKGEDPEMGRGFDLLPGAILDQHFSQRRRLPRLSKAVILHPNLVGVGIDEDTAIVYDRGKASVIGSNTVTVLTKGDKKILKKGESFNCGTIETAHQDTNTKQSQGN